MQDEAGGWLDLEITMPTPLATAISSKVSITVEPTIK